MTTPLTVECLVHFDRRGHGAQKELTKGPTPVAAPPRVPRVAKLMALALRLDEMRRSGAVADYAELARLGHVTRARMSQIMSLINLAPDIQEALLLLPPVDSGRDPIILRDLMPMAMQADWQRQRRSWRQLTSA